MREKLGAFFDQLCSSVEEGDNGGRNWRRGGRYIYILIKKNVVGLGDFHGVGFCNQL